MGSDRLPYQLTFRSDDAFETKLHEALRLLPRGYGKLFFMRLCRSLISTDADVATMRRLIEDFVVTPNVQITVPKSGPSKGGVTTSSGAKR